MDVLNFIVTNAGNILTVLFGVFAGLYLYKYQRKTLEDLLHQAMMLAQKQLADQEGQAKLESAVQKVVEELELSYPLMKKACGLLAKFTGKTLEQWVTALMQDAFDRLFKQGQ